MKALNLFTLTRDREKEDFSRLAHALSGRVWQKSFSPHEAASLCALVDSLTQCFIKDGGAEGPGSGSEGAAAQGWMSLFDGFWFSYTIEHISKEFDLLKFSADGSCILNVELKSEGIEEERIRRQLDQNRYYLSHISRTILSYTYVMAEDALYCLNDHGYLKKCPVDELAQAMKRPALQKFVEDEIGRFFRAQDYLISPVKTPEKFLSGRYFLTNQQAEFRRQILEQMEAKENIPAISRLRETGQPKAGRGEAKGGVPVISLTGNAGTGKTLLMFNLALELSRRRRVLFLHGGPLLEGHRIIDRRLHKVRILSGTQMGAKEIVKMLEGKEGVQPHLQFDYLLVDEANRFSPPSLEKLLMRAKECGIPCIFSYDPHSILEPIPSMEEAEAVIARSETLRLELSGNIRINRPIFSFLRTLFHQKDRTGHADYSCIDILYADSRREARLLAAHYFAKGYERIDVSPESFRSGKIISQEFDRVLMVLDRRFYYDESLRLCADGLRADGTCADGLRADGLCAEGMRADGMCADGMCADVMCAEGTKGAAIPLLYEGLSRAREKLCLIVVENRELFSQILAIRTMNQC